MLVTLDTSQFEMSPLNDFALSNNALISFTFDVTQDPIGPCAPLEQAASDAFRHAAMAALSSTFDFGAQSAVVVGTCVVSYVRS